MNRPLQRDSPSKAAWRLSRHILALCIWMGPHAACWRIAVATFIAAWVRLCCRFPSFVWFTDDLSSTASYGAPRLPLRHLLPSAPPPPMRPLL